MVIVVKVDSDDNFGVYLTLGCNNQPNDRLSCELQSIWYTTVGGLRKLALFK